MTSPQQPAQTHAEIEDYWLKGYFAVSHADRRGKRVRTGRWKNLDFLRLRDVGLHLLDLGPDKTILDIGCADGATMIYGGLQGATMKGIDLDAPRVEKANELLRKYGVRGEAVAGDATKLPFPDNFFDAAISSDFFEHVHDEQKIEILRETRRVLKPGGMIVTKTPNRKYLELSLLYKRLRAVARFENPMKYVIPETPGTENPQHIGLTTRWELARCLREAGFANYEFHYAPLRRFGTHASVEVLSTEIPLVRDYLCEDVFSRAYKPIVLSHFPD